MRCWVRLFSDLHYVMESFVWYQFFYFFLIIMLTCWPKHTIKKVVLDFYTVLFFLPLNPRWICCSSSLSNLVGRPVVRCIRLDQSLFSPWTWLIRLTSPSNLSIKLQLLFLRPIRSGNSHTYFQLFNNVSRIPYLLLMTKFSVERFR